MAVLKEAKAKSRIKIDGMPPKGTYIATCIDVEDNFGVQRPKFDNPAEMEIVDLTSFYFGFRAKGGEHWIIKSRGFKLSLHEKSALFAFLKAWNNEAPKAGFDTLSMKGKGAQISIDHSVSQKGRAFANVSSILPVMEGLENLVVPVDAFEQYLAPQNSDVEPPDDLPF